MKKNYCLAFLLLFSIAAFGQEKYISTYRNPVIPGDVPDPTVIRVGETFYAAGTTSDFAPNYPIYQSDDLVNWDQIGFIFHEPPAWTMGSFWAPELYHKNGTFYVFYTARRASDKVSCIGVATTQDLSKGFTDQGILIEWGNEAIDAFVFEDTDGKFYISWKAYGLNPDRPIEILGSEFNLEKLALVGEHFTMTPHDEGWSGRGDEGQTIVKRGDYYYMFYSVGGCCDNRCDYAVQVARSKNIRNGWKQYEKGPIMHGGGDWLCTGHGTLVQTADGRDFYLYHSYNATDFEFIGRQGMLDQVLWDNETGWPFFKYGPIPSIQAEVPFQGTVQQLDTLFTDDFSSDAKLKFWQWDMHAGKPEIKITNQQLELQSAKAGVAFLGMTPKTGHYTLEAGLAQGNANLKGICVYGDQSHWLGFGRNGSKLQLIQMKEGNKTILSESEIATQGPVYLKAEAINGRFFRFYWSADQKSWKPFNNENFADGSFLPRWGVAMRVGLMVDQNSSGAFTSFQLKNQF